jgi:putative ABC transport system ATP-binding protein
MELYKVHNLSRTYSENGLRVSAVRGVDLTVEKGEFLALAGPSGSGKTTLLNLLGLIDSADAGTLSFEGHDVSALPEAQRNVIRRDRMGFIFQSFNLIPVLTAYENVEYFLLKRNVRSAEVRERVDEALTGVGLLDKRNRLVTKLSGGERQRVAIARAIVRNVDVILADEPTAALDRVTARSILGLMQRLNAERGVTFIFSSHDPAVLNTANRVVHLADGELA